MKVPQGFENYWAADVLLLLMKAIYGINQEVIAFWKEIPKLMMNMKYKINVADPYMYFKWSKSGLFICP